jgi:hypothetical protein
VKHFFCRTGGPAPAAWTLALLAALLPGCSRNEIQVYRVAKEAPQTQPQGMPPGHPDISGAPAPAPASASASAPALKYKLPSGWQEVAPGEMRAASFRVAGKAGKLADVSVIPLPGLAGGDLDNVNRWRGQVELKGVTAEELAKLAQPVTIDRNPAPLYEQAGETPGSGEKTRILAAITRREGVAWFFKMTGDDELVAQQKPAFIEFLESVAFPAASAQAELPPSHPPIGGGSMPLPTLPVVAAGQDKPSWQAPAGWQEVSGGGFLVAKFLIGGSGNAQAAVNVSMSAGDGGGVLANLNRWRGQLGLGPVTEADLGKEVQPFDVPGSQAMLTGMTGTDPKTGQPAQLLAVIVPQAGQTWFYKLMGNEQVVQREKEAFTKFVQTVKYSHAP